MHVTDEMVEAYRRAARAALERDEKYSDEVRAGLEAALGAAPFARDGGSVKRYIINYDARGEQEHPSGDFVHYADHVAALRAAPAAEPVADGWVLVPREPTEDMIQEAHRQIDWCRNEENTHRPDHPSQTNGGGTSCRQDLIDAWDAMLAAAPTPVADGFEFSVGQRVEKVSGYRWPGVIVSAFRTTAGQERYVVECTAPEVAGALHIYAPGRLAATILKGDTV